MVCHLRVLTRDYSCRCRFEFCYLCAAQWKTCTCNEWDENRLRDRARQILARDEYDSESESSLDSYTDSDDGQGHDRGQGGVIRRNLSRFAAVMANLVNHGGCRHGAWLDSGDWLICEVCDRQRPWQILECARCGILACRDCRYHRF
ncbi:hypothetical protein MN608_05586 [Microdochium nivale]|nr:hypothetical protein MN608_05586 [Microdochium nivale]